MDPRYAGRVLADPGCAAVDGAGIGVLAGLIGHLDETAMLRWLAAFRGGSAGVFGLGRAGFVGGLTVAAAVEPRVAGLAASARAGLVNWARGYREEPGRWSDYDLIAGPAGVLLALTIGGHSAGVDPLARHLARRTAATDLAGLRVDGRINLGLGHGVPGVVLALVAARRVLGARPWLTAALRNCVAVLLAAAATDQWGMPVWGTTSDRIDAWRTRQAWCYGTPGVAWALWEAGETEVALEAMAGLDRAWDPDRHLRGDTVDVLGVCHGAAGVLAIADAFARHARHQPSAQLRARLAEWLESRRDSLRGLATTDLTLLGAAGVFAVLLTAAGGRRDWLPLLGLR